MKSAPYRLHGKLFRYNFSGSTVEYIAKATPQEVADEREWAETHSGFPLLGIGTDGYIVIDTIGMSRENWADTEARDAYLTAWAEDLDEETQRLAEEFVRYELPYLV